MLEQLPGLRKATLTDGFTQFTDFAAPGRTRGFNPA